MVSLLAAILATTGATIVPLAEMAAADIGLSEDQAVSRGVAFADFDGDGDPDAAIANTDGGPISLYRNKGTDGFEPWRDAALGSSIANHEGIAAPDFDNDGFPDLFVAVTGGENLLFRNIAGRSFEKVAAGDLTADTGNWSQGCWADYDNDGLLDVFVVQSGPGPAAMFRNVADGKFARVAGPWDAAADDSRSCAAADPDADGLPDLYVTNAHIGEGDSRRMAPNSFYGNSGAWTFTKLERGEMVNDTGYSYAASWFDYDQDGDEDLLVTNIDRYTPNAIYRNDGESGFLPDWSSAMAGDRIGPGKGHVWSDFDLDGDADLFIAEGHGGARPEHFPFDSTDRFYRQGAAGWAVSELGDATRRDRVSAGAAAADVDLDGDQDLLVAIWQGEDLGNEFYRNGAAGAATSFALKGTRSNRQGVGARIVLTSGDRVQYRSIWLNSGYGSHSEPVAHFGLATNEAVSVEVTWTRISAWPRMKR